MSTIKREIVGPNGLCVIRIDEPQYGRFVLTMSENSRNIRTLHFTIEEHSKGWFIRDSEGQLWDTLSVLVWHDRGGQSVLSLTLASKVVPPFERPRITITCNPVDPQPRFHIHLNLPS